MAECNTCGNYMSVEDLIRRSAKCNADGKVSFVGAEVNQKVDLPLKLTNAPASLVSDFNSLTGHSVTAVTASMALNTTEFIEGGKSIKVTSTPTYNYFEFARVAPFDLSANNAVDLKVRIYPHSDPTKIQHINILAMNADGSYFYADYYQDNPWTQNEWRMLAGRTWTKSGNASWAAVSRFIFRVYKTVGETVEISFDLCDWNVDKKKAIMIMFDDGNDTDYTIAYPLLRSKKMVATSYIISSLVSGVNRMAPVQIKALHDSKWCIGNHTATHPDLTTLTSEQIGVELQTCADYLESIGVANNPKHISYPGGAANSDTYAALQTWGALTGRDIAATHNFYDIGFPYAHLNVYPPPYNEAVATTKAWIDKALQIGATPGLLFHRLQTVATEYNYSIANFTEIINYIETLGLQTITIDEYYRLNSNAIAVYHK